MSTGREQEGRYPIENEIDIIARKLRAGGVVDISNEATISALANALIAHPLFESDENNVAHTPIRITEALTAFLTNPYRPNEEGVFQRAIVGRSVHIRGDVETWSLRACPNVFRPLREEDLRKLFPRHPYQAYEVTDEKLRSGNVLLRVSCHSQRLGLAATLAHEVNNRDLFEHERQRILLLEKGVSQALAETVVKSGAQGWV